MDVGFEAELRALLERIAGGRPVPQLVQHRHVNEDDLRSHLLVRLRESGRERWVRVTHERWSPRITRFARFLETLPATAAPTTLATAAIFARSALDYVIGCLPDTTDLIDRLELGRLLAGFLSFEYREDGLFDVDGYALGTNSFVVNPTRHCN